MKFTTVFLVSVVLIALAAACASGGGDGVAPIGNATGSASATAPGFGGDITVTVTMANGVITEVTIVGDGETPTVGGTAITRAPGMIKKYNSAQFDAISGATITSQGIIEAAQAAIDKISSN